MGEVATKSTERVMENLPNQKDRKLLNLAKILRRKLTPQERRLWYEFLRTYPAKIYKQRIVGNYIADFYCHKAKLVIELDGSQHYSTDGKQHDDLRTKNLEQYGLSVLRFSNLEVNNNFDGVCLMIDKTIKERIKQNN